MGMILMTMSCVRGNRRAFASFKGIELLVEWLKLAITHNNNNNNDQVVRWIINCLSIIVNQKQERISLLTELNAIDLFVDLLLTRKNVGYVKVCELITHLCYGNNKFKIASKLGISSLFVF